MSFKCNNSVEKTNSAHKESFKHYLKGAMESERDNEEQIKQSYIDFYGEYPLKQEEDKEYIAELKKISLRKNS